MQEKKHGLSKREIVIVTIMLVLLITVVSSIFLLFIHPLPILFSLKAAIIDQLGAELPNPAFVNNATITLEAYGFNVTYYNETIDVDFFKELAKRNYGIIILRAHSALRDDSSTVDLFTSEPYVSSAHSDEQDNGLVVKGTLYYTRTPQGYFAVTSKFIENLEGTFPKSIVIAMGCWGMKPGLEQTLAGAFVRKGATAFLGWTNLVGYSHSDDETSKLLTNLFVHNKTLDEAVGGTEQDIWYYGSQMRYYPSEAGSLRISDLVAEANANTTSKLQLATSPYDLMQTLTATDCQPKVFKTELDKADSLDVSLVSKRSGSTGCGGHRLKD
jgi:hypothetical protein